MNTIRFVFGAVLSTAAVSAYATDLSFAGTADDGFIAYVSTSSNSVGASFLSGVSWSTTFTGNVTLTPGVTNYLHIDAFDTAGAPSMFIAELNLSDANFFFDNATQTALTGDAGWTVSLAGFGGTPSVITDLGPNGTSPWGTRPGIASGASYLWTTDGAVTDHRFFTIAINTTTVPEPASIAAVLGGALVLLRRRKVTR